MKRLVVLFLVLAVGSMSYSQLAKKDKMPVTTSSKEALASYNEAFRYFEDVDLPKGTELLQKALTEDPDFFMANYYMALMSMTNEEKFKSYGNAAVNCKAKLSEAEKLIKSTMVALLEKKDADVTETGEKIVEMYPKDIYAYWVLLNLQDIAGDTNGYHSTLLKALEITPNPAPVYNMLGYSYMRLNQNDKAEEAFDKYIQLAPDNPNVYDSKGDFYMNIKEYEKAYDAYMKSNSLNPAWGLSKAKKAKHLYEVEEPARIAVTALLDKFNSAFKAKDPGTLASILADNGIYCGTDPSEIWNKKQTVAGFEQGLGDPALVIDYTIDKRKILIAEDGESAIAVEQAFYKFVSPGIPWRMIYHAVKTGDAWKFDFISWNFIPRNEDIGKINKAVGQ
ncbi:tetratricopeptide repeat protein [bacterium]|nr:tetratricopeptide repeat protein [bacterium]